MCPLKTRTKVSYRCSLPSPLQKRSKDYKGLHRSSASFELLSFVWLWQEESWETSCQSYKFLQFLQIPFLTSSTLWSLLLLFSLFIPNLCPHCFHWLSRSSSFPHWCRIQTLCYCSAHHFGTWSIQVELVQMQLELLGFPPGVLGLTP